jgi:hypothetical protein
VPLLLQRLSGERGDLVGEKLEAKAEFGHSAGKGNKRSQCKHRQSNQSRGNSG